MHRMVLGKSGSGVGHRTIESGRSAANKLSSFEKIFINRCNYSLTMLSLVLNGRVFCQKEEVRILTISFFDTGTDPVQFFQNHFTPKPPIRRKQPRGAGAGGEERMTDAPCPATHCDMAAGKTLALAQRVGIVSDNHFFRLRLLQEKNHDFYPSSL